MEKQKKSQKNSVWKNVAHGFVENMIEHVGDNISHKAHAWLLKLKKRTAGTALMVLGITFLLSGIAVYANTIFENVIPGIGYVIVGVVIFLLGWIVSRD